MGDPNGTPTSPTPANSPVTDWTDLLKRHPMAIAISLLVSGASGGVGAYVAVDSFIEKRVKEIMNREKKDYIGPPGKNGERGPPGPPARIPSSFGVASKENIRIANGIIERANLNGGSYSNTNGFIIIEASKDYPVCTLNSLYTAGGVGSCELHFEENQKRWFIQAKGGLSCRVNCIKLEATP